MLFQIGQTHKFKWTEGACLRVSVHWVVAEVHIPVEHEHLLLLTQISPGRQFSPTPLLQVPQVCQIM